VSGADGRFLLRDVAPGTWPVRAQSSTHQAIGPPPVVTVTAGETPPEVQIRLRRSEGQEQLYAGVGMSLMEHDGHKFAGEVFEGGPAKAAGVRSGDLIVAIDGQAADGLSLGDVVGLIRGPSGSEISLDMQRGQGQSYSVVVPRAEIRF
jgi:C-terminal processing protease CtpA/Prc